MDRWTAEKLNTLLVDAGHAINVNNGRCELIEDVLCRLTGLVCDLLNHQEADSDAYSRGFEEGQRRQIAAHCEQ